MRNLRNAKGFTLIELMIVVVIIGILAAIAIPKFNQVAKNAKESEADGILKQGYTLQEEYKQKYDTYAPNDDSLVKVGWDKDQTGRYYSNITVDNGDGDSFCIEAQSTDTSVTKNKYMDEDRVVEDGLCP